MLMVNGLVISERNVGEQDKYISVLTAEYGTIEIFVKGANKITGKNQATTQLFAYSKLCINIKNDRYYLDSSELIHDFFNLRLDIKKLALCCYFGEVTRFSVLARNRKHEGDVMRLMLNCLYMLSEGKRSCEFIKSVFELRFMAEVGFIPQLIGCRLCYSFDKDDFYFILDKCYVLCSYHFDQRGYEEDYYKVKITPGELTALQFICLADFNRLYNFRLTPKGQKKINEITEKYILFHLSRPFNSLSYYHSLE